MNSRAYQKYNRYNNWWLTIEKLLVRIAILLFIALYASQFANFIIVQKGGSLLTKQIEKYEGKPISDSQTKINTGTVELAVTSNSDYRNMQIFVNGEYYTGFDKKSVTLTVKNNDIIEVNGINNEYPAKIRITSVSDNISGIRQDDTILVNKNLVNAGRIRLK
jgi:hypothetical protein